MDEPLIRIDLSVEERLERLERAVFNIDTCDRCKEDFGGTQWSKHYNHNGLRVCWTCFQEMNDEKSNN